MAAVAIFSTTVQKIVALTAQFPYIQMYEECHSDNQSATPAPNPIKRFGWVAVNI